MVLATEEKEVLWDYASIDTLTSEDLSYIAGFFDGEGTVYIYRGGLFVSVSNTDLTVLDWLKESFGGSVVTHKPKPPRKTVYHWTVASRIGATFLYAIQPYVKMKGERIELALEFQRTIRPGTSPDKYSMEELAYREFLHSGLKELNRRGDGSKSD